MWRWRWCGRDGGATEPVSASQGCTARCEYQYRLVLSYAARMICPRPPGGCWLPQTRGGLTAAAHLQARPAAQTSCCVTYFPASLLLSHNLLSSLRVQNSRSDRSHPDLHRQFSSSRFRSRSTTARVRYSDRVARPWLILF